MNPTNGVQTYSAINRGYLDNQILVIKVACNLRKRVSLLFIIIINNVLSLLTIGRIDWISPTFRNGKAEQHHWASGINLFGRNWFPYLSLSFSLFLSLSLSLFLCLFVFVYDYKAKWNQMKVYKATLHHFVKSFKRLKDFIFRKSNKTDLQRFSIQGLIWDVPLTTKNFSGWKVIEKTIQDLN